MIALKERGHNISCCAQPDEYVSRLKSLGFNYIPLRIDRKGENLYREILLILKLFILYRKEKPELILHSSIKPNIYGSLAAWLAGRRCVNTISGLGYVFIRNNLLTKLIEYFYKIACALSERTYFQNKEDMQYFIENKLIKPEKSYLVAGDGIDTDYFKPYKEKCPYTNDGNIRFLFLGRMLWDKGIGELVEAVRMVQPQYPVLKPCLLGMIDKGNPAGISRWQIQEWEKEGLITYLGEASDVRPYLNNCDCVVLPSYREGLPRALLEASSMELPVIATNVPGCREVVEHGITGFLVEAKSTPDLADAMRKILLLTESERREMGAKGRKKMISEFSEKKVVETYCTQLGI